MANTDVVDKWVQQRVQSRVARGAINPPTNPQARIPTNPIPTSKDMGLAGKIGTGLQKATDFVYGLPGPVGGFYKGAAGLSGKTLETLNKFAVDPVRHFVAGGAEQIQKTWKDPTMGVVEKTIRSTPQAAAIAGVKNALGEKKTFGNGVDVSAGLIPDKKLISPEMGAKLYDNPINDALFGKGTAGKVASAVSNPNWAANFAADVITPGIPIATVLKPAVKAIAGSKTAQKVAEAATKFVEDRPKLAGAVEAIRPGTIYPEAEKAMQGALTNTRVRQAELESTLQQLTKDLSPDEITHLADVVEKKATANDPKIQAIADQINTISDKVGKEAVDVGNMTQESLDKFKGQYMSHIPDRTVESIGSGELPKDFRTGGSFASGAQASSFKKRTGALEEYSRQVPAVAQLSLGQEIQANERAKALGTIVGKHGVTTDILPSGHTYIDELKSVPETIRNKYKGVSVPSVIADKISEAYTRQKPNLGDKLLNVWKSWKTTMAGTPAYFIRNQESNITQASIKTGRNLAQEGVENGKAMAELLGIKATDSKLLSEFNSVSDMSSNVDRARRLLLGKGMTYSGNILNPNEFQKLQEAGAKYSLFKYFRQKGLDVGQAWEQADSTIFSPYRVSGKEKGLMKMLVPFYQWQRQEIPFFFKTYAEHPERYAVYSKTKQHVENLSEPPKTPPPGYYQGQIRLPVKDQSGDNLYYDPTYSLPFGSMIKGAGENDMPFGFNPNPLLDLGPILKNQHPEYGTPLSKSADPGEVNKAIVRQVAETFGPNAVREIGTNLPAALKGEEEPYTGKNRSLRQFVYKQLGTKIAGYSEKKQLQSTQFKLKDIEDNYKSMRYKLLDQLKRRVIDQKTYQEKLKLERDAYLKAKQNAASN